MKDKTTISKLLPWLMLLSRSALFLFFQTIFALFFLFMGRSNVWNLGAGYWPVGVFLSNLVSLYILIRLFRGEGKRYWDLFRINKATVKTDLLVLVLSLPVIGALGFFPNLVLGKWLFGDSLIALGMYIQPLPVWAVIVAVLLFPITQGLAELPVYFGYSLPRIDSQTGKPWLAVFLSGLALSSQHIFAPFIPDIRFILWRGLMFLLFALSLGILLKWRPRLLPYLVLVHILMDFSLAPYFLGM